ncbi:phosphate uptake regulator, PhoU [Rhodopirellula maiorica SM1]|uniref:Phosphate-specific transport system accessory protein PhoU n=1 Tax=Rhodopirellula maiorica SM1 TaxID=1265738 RepID=M5RI30_9BACT|nr:phosphate signaling complex protein PhoU [Rhodopirellula maiorica]EMI18968.1 phosphate uptake regulator, PhoU [Rhodopirellula maiorica SM1]
MMKHLNRDMDHLHRDILSLSAVVEEMIVNAGKSLSEGRVDLAEKVIRDDDAVDHQEVAIEDECLKVLALHHPVATDLRRIATVIKVNNDLERIADLAVSVAQRAIGVKDYPRFVIPDGVGPMVSEVTGMVRAALDAFVNMDTDAAKRVILRDDEVDALNTDLINHLRLTMQKDAQLVAAALHCFSAIRHLERIADLATNIAEDAIYLVDGEIVRHRSVLKRDC